MATEVGIIIPSCNGLVIMTMKRIVEPKTTITHSNIQSTDRIVQYLRIKKMHVMIISNLIFVPN